jgi:hypothetical protein
MKRETKVRKHGNAGEGDDTQQKPGRNLPPNEIHKRANCRNEGNQGEDGQDSPEAQDAEHHGKPEAHDDER